MGGRAEARMIASSSLCSLIASPDSEWKSDATAAGALIRSARICTICESSPRA